MHSGRSFMFDRNVSRAASLRQLSNSFAQFNNLHVLLRSRKPLTRKDAAVINEWRLSKLRKYKERNIEVENEGFDHYMQKVELLKEVLLVESMEDNTPSVPDSNHISMENDKGSFFFYKNDKGSCAMELEDNNETPKNQIYL
ncbi:hypothetical protein K1719_039005 [Acacia pycnantha]|nr:hypothetical protein K1719_039005 [Acacia pycnantha]